MSQIFIYSCAGCPCFCVHTDAAHICGVFCLIYSSNWCTNMGGKKSSHYGKGTYRQICTRTKKTKQKALLSTATLFCKRPLTFCLYSPVCAPTTQTWNSPSLTPPPPQHPTSNPLIANEEKSCRLNRRGIAMATSPLDCYEMRFLRVFVLLICCWFLASWRKCGANAAASTHQRALMPRLYRVLCRCQIQW